MTNPPEEKGPFPEPTPTGETIKSSEPEPSAKPGPFEGKKEEISFKGIRPGGKQKGEDFLAFARDNTKDTIAYILMIVGILMIFFEPLYGGLIVGIIFSLYFSKELNHLWEHLNDLIEEYGMVKSLILGGTLLALFISAPFVFIGAAVITGLKVLIAPEAGQGSKQEKK